MTTKAGEYKFVEHRIIWGNSVPVFVDKQNVEFARFVGIDGNLYRQDLPICGDNGTPAPGR